MVQTGWRDYGTLEKSVCSIILPTQSRLCLILLSNAHSVCLNLHLLALSAACNVCAAWQKVSVWKGKHRTKFVLLTTRSLWCSLAPLIVSAAGREASNGFLQSSLGCSAPADRKFLWITLWRYLLKSLLCFRAIVWLCLFWKPFVYPNFFLCCEICAPLLCPCLIWAAV